MRPCVGAGEDRRGNVGELGAIYRDRAVPVVGERGKRHRPDALGAGGAEHFGVGLEATVAWLPPADLDVRPNAAGPIDRHHAVVVDRVLTELAVADRGGHPNRFRVTQ